MDSNINSSYLSENCAKIDFNHDLEDVNNLTNQRDNNIITDNKERKIGVMKCVSFFENPKSAAEFELTVEPQSIPKKKLKKKLYTNTESIGSSENVSDLRFDIKETHLERKYKKRCKLEKI
ncbi:hypothetical protein NPIL_276321 [Nephila pilipes]|uniref:Uncharacterized protein n=1 Tax=Nephila pilipes TaxID=299642 RepID=A0A8X6Q0W3_NEPPI|nr:hypothetical protein NPIL_276321 [Nephila pilipes]